MTMIQSELKRVTIPQDKNASSDKIEIIMMLWESSAKFEKGNAIWIGVRSSY